MLTELNCIDFNSVSVTSCCGSGMGGMMSIPKLKSGSPSPLLPQNVTVFEEIIGGNMRAYWLRGD